MCLTVGSHACVAIRLALGEPTRDGVWDDRHGRFIIESPALVQSLERLDAPVASFLRVVHRTTFPRLTEVTLRQPSDEMLDLLAAWTRGLPALRELRFVAVPIGEMEHLVDRLERAALMTPERELSIEPTIGWEVPKRMRDPGLWFRLLHPRRQVARAAVRLRATTIRVEWSEKRDSLAVTFETDEGGDLFHVLEGLPARITRLVFRDPPDEKPRRLEGLGRLRRILDAIAPEKVEMPTRWKNQLAALPDAPS